MAKKVKLRDTPLPDARVKDAKYDPILQLCRAQGMTLQQSAKQAGCSIQTAFRREQDPAFLVGIRALRERIVEEGVSLLSALFVKAIQKVEAILEAADTPPSLQLQAARTVIDSLVKCREHVILANQVEALQARLKGIAEGTNGQATEGTAEANAAPAAEAGH